MTGVVLDGAGWLGGIAVAVGYVLVITRRIAPESRLFQILNIVGGVLLTMTTVYRQALPNTVINVVWIVFGVYGMVAARRRQRAARSAAVEDPLPDEAAVEPTPVLSSAARP